MTYPAGQFPNETYHDGLRDNPESSIAVLYHEFRPAILRGFSIQGVPESDAAFYFQMAVNDAVRIARAGKLPQGVPFPIFLESLSLAHADTAANRSIFAPRTFVGDAPNPLQLPLPTAEELRATQNKAVVYACLQGMDAECREALLTQPTDETEASPERQASCSGQLLQALRNSGADVADTLPDWAAAALRTPEGFVVWQRTQLLERGWSAEKPPPPPEPSSDIWRWAVAAFLLVLVGYGAYQFFYRPKTAAEVFADNFSPPGSLIADLQARYGDEMGNDSASVRPSACMLLLREADMMYQSGNYEAAMDPLLLLVLDSASLCRSDAWYFLGIIQLHLEDPATAVQCFAKIEDLERYGEDLYWYQALAFVQMAKGNPLLRERAKHAIERTLNNTRDPERRAQAETMLENLSK